MMPDKWRDLLVSWANINSGSDNLHGLERMFGVLRAEFARLPGADVEDVALAGTTAKALRVRTRPTAPVQVLLSGHYDTVYGVDHAFQACSQVDANTLCGPGVADMKGGIVVMLAALTEFERRCKEAGNIGWEVLLGPDEEVGSPWTRGLWEEAARRNRLGLVFEPCRENGNVIGARKGTGIFRVVCHGRAAHAGRDASAGRNAIVALAELLPGIDAIGREFPGVMVNIGRIAGGGAVNIVPDFAEVLVNVRVSKAGDEERVTGRLRDLAARIDAREGFRMEISGKINRPPKEVTAREEELFRQWLACAHEAGVDCDVQSVDGGSDGNLLAAAGLPTLDGLGVQGGRTHSAEEYVKLDSIAARAEATVRFLERMARGELGSGAK